jgi:hypothetical protein
MPNLGCLTVHPETKVVSNRVKRIWLGFKFFPVGSLGSLAPFWYSDQVVLAPFTK